MKSIQKYWQHKQGSPHFGNPRTWRIVWLLFKESYKLTLFPGTSLTFFGDNSQKVLVWGCSNFFTFLTRAPHLRLNAGLCFYTYCLNALFYHYQTKYTLEQKEGDCTILNLKEIWTFLVFLEYTFSSSKFCKYFCIFELPVSRALKLYNLFARFLLNNLQ